MGTDIHSMLEIKSRVYEDGSSEPVTRWRRNTAGIFRDSYFDHTRPITPANHPYTADPLDDRNYRLFAMLADVRNGSGFAGIDTGDRVEPISAPRGVPADASPEWLAEVAGWGADMHSQSYFTLAELDEYDWDGLVFERGYIPEQQYRDLVEADSGNGPDSYSGHISGPGIITLTAREYESLTAWELDALHVGDFSQFPQTESRSGSVFRERKWTALPQGSKPRIYVQHQWAETRRQNMGELAEAMKVMRDSAPREFDVDTRTWGEPDPTRIRIVFGFDS